MGTFSKGLYGAFKGKVGSLVGSTWKGIEVLRSKPAAGKGKFSPEQLQQQAKFALMTKFLQPLTSLINTTYAATAVQMSGFNKAFLVNNEAIKCTIEQAGLYWPALSGYTYRITCLWKNNMYGRQYLSGFSGFFC